MKVRLDHIGVAVRDVAEALAFYRDALGLEVEGIEEVASQRVRAHFVPLGNASLELLEATTPESTIAKFVERRGPGLHHVTLRVDDIDLALAELKQRGVRLIDERARPGAEGARVAFIHPAAAHGVLVELKESTVRTDDRPFHASDSATQTVRRFTVGDLEIVSLYDGYFRVDGGSMFGVVPRPMWSAVAPADGRNRIQLAMRPLLIRGRRTVLIDAGIGGKEDARFADIYALDRAKHLDHALAEAGVAPDEIDVVVATHLHFDHAGGFTIRDASGRLRPRFPRARYVVRRGEWEDAVHPHARSRAAYLADNFAPLAAAGVLDLVDEDATVMPGVRVRRAAGHTAHHQMIWAESGGHCAAYVGDLIPTVAHVPEAWITAFDLFPGETLTTKQACLDEALARGALVFFPHDPVVAAGYVHEVDGRRRVHPV
jgi:methylmalonyl-CoA epimerase